VFFLFLAAMTVLYLAAVEVVKRWFYRRHASGEATSGSAPMPRGATGAARACRP
jgi:hypothetical protein